MWIPSRVLATSGAVAAAAAAARRDYAAGEELSLSTQALMWPVYAAGAAFIASELWRSRGMGSRLSRMTGGLLVAAGTALSAAGASSFRSFGDLAGRSTGALLTDGAYRFSRHPQYAGNVLLATGASVAARSVAGATFALVTAAAYASYVPAEEAHLSRTFGPAYDDYASTTPRWIGVRGVIARSRNGGSRGR